jgi:hypothetical protein
MTKLVYTFCFLERTIKFQSLENIFLVPDMNTLFIDLQESLKYIWNRSLSNRLCRFWPYLHWVWIEYRLDMTLPFSNELHIDRDLYPLILGYRSVPQILGLDIFNKSSTNLGHRILTVNKYLFCWRWGDNLTVLSLSKTPRWEHLRHVSSIQTRRSRSIPHPAKSWGPRSPIYRVMP